MRRLLIRPGAMGDCILSLPALEHLRADYTEVWVPSPIVPLIQFADRADSIASTGIDRIGLNSEEDIPPHLLARLRRFDEIVSWYGASRPDFRAALTSTKVRCVFHPALPKEDSTVHATDFFCAQVGAPSDLSPRIDVAPLPRRRAIVMQPFSGSPRKNWPLESYRQLADVLPLPVEWLAGPDETLNDAHRFDSLFDLAQWIAAATLYIGNDSGVTHLAAAVGTPVIALFRSTNPAIWAPRGRACKALFAKSTQSGFIVESVLEFMKKL